VETMTPFLCANDDVRDGALIFFVNRVFSSKILQMDFVFCFAIENSRGKTGSFKTLSSNTNSFLLSHSAIENVLNVYVPHSHDKQQLPEFVCKIPI